jgi:TRAP-type C4-dicarboxylate transport system substrate-binding protein
MMLAAGGALLAGPTMLKFSHTDQQAGTRHAAAMLFAEKVKNYTQDRYEVRVYPAGQLGNDPKNIEQLQLGGIDFTVSSTGSYAPHIDSLNLTSMTPPSGSRPSSTRLPPRVSASWPPGKPGSAA